MMAFEFHHLDKWCFANIDLAEEALEQNKKAVIVIAGASSSGKSFSAAALENMLCDHHHKAVTISLDQYNFGLSGIIPNKVNENYFNSKLTNISQISKAIKPILLDYSFQNKYGEECLSRIEGILARFLKEEEIPVFLKGLKEEWKVLNFDEPSVYNLKEAAEDIKKLCKNEKIPAKKYSKIVSERIPCRKKIDGGKYDIIIVEGIYALDKSFLSELEGLPYIANFIDGNAKSLFLRRIIRDKFSTSAASAFTTHLYFKYIIPSYKETIAPTRNNADVILNNNMSFNELRSGELYITKDGFAITNAKAIDFLLKNSEIRSTHYEKDYYFTAFNEAKPSDNILRFRLRKHSKEEKYELGSLVHKGTPKVRKDNKIIRPINILLNESEIKEVWKDEESALKDFKSADFVIDRIEAKTKTRITYKGQKLTLFQVEGGKNYIEIVEPLHEDTIAEIKSLIK